MGKKNYKAANYSVTIELEKSPNDVFTHEGLFPKKECYPLVHQGWNTVIKDYLFHFITDGKIAEQLYR